MNIIKKTSFLLLLLFSIKLLLSCCNCDDQVYYYDVNRVKIKNIDNSGRFPIRMSDSTMHREALAFELCFSDTAGWNSVCKNRSFGGFSEAYACSCRESMMPRQKIAGIKVLTLMELSSTIPPNSDVTNNFYTASGGGLYVPLQESIAPGKPVNSLALQIFYKGAIETDQIQFLISTHLDDGRVVSDTTNLIQIID